MMEPTAFSSPWWDRFLTATDHTSKTTVFRECLSKEEVALFRSYILEILRELARLRTIKYGYRVFIDGTLLEENEMSQVYDMPPIEGESLEEWAERAFQNKKFGMIINEGEKFVFELSKNIALKLSPLLEKVGFPREGINFTLFIGNYDKTPLGIHKDKAGESVIHFHLGPGAKRMYTWDEAEYLDLLENKGYKREDVTSLLPYATQHVFGEGDLYFMPQGEYHIGQQDGLSIGLTVWQYNHTKAMLLKRLQRVVENQYYQASTDLLTSDKNDLEDVSGLDGTLETLDIPEELDGMDYKSLIREAYRDLRYSIHSNAGYRTSPFPKPEDTFLDPGKIVEIEHPFKILYKESFDRSKLHLFVRGVKVVFNNFDCIKSLVNALNSGGQYKVSELLLLLEQDWNEDIGLYILSTIYRHHGIKLVE